MTAQKVRKSTAADPINEIDDMEKMMDEIEMMAKSEIRGKHLSTEADINSASASKLGSHSIHET